MTGNDRKDNLERYKKERNREINQMADAEEREELQMPELSRGKYLHDFKVCSLNLKERCKWNNENFALKIFNFQFLSIVDEQDGYH